MCGLHSWQAPDRGEEREIVVGIVAWRRQTDKGQPLKATVFFTVREVLSRGSSDFVFLADPGFLCEKMSRWARTGESRKLGPT
jgi:hypothetical protein